jgi:L-arabinonolactonase
MRAELLVDCRCEHGEGVLWSSAHGLVMWSDITGSRIHALDPVSGQHQVWVAPGEVGCFAPRAGRPATQLVAGVKEGFALIDLATGQRQDLHATQQGNPALRMNDGRTDREGRFVAGSYDTSGGTAGTVWRLDPDLTLTRLFDGVTVSNGTCFSADGRTMYFADSATQRVDAFAYGVDGLPAGRRPVAPTPAPGYPDGSCIDAEGGIWNAVWEGYRVERWLPDGRRDRVVEVPVKKPSCVSFGGPDLDQLYITTSRQGETPEDLAREPTAGSLYVCTPGVRGLADQPFAG